MSGCKSGILKAIAMLQETFDKYAGAEGDPNTLTKKEIATMFKAELPGVADKSGPEADKLFKMLDDDGDGTVNFNEYIVFCATLAMVFKGH